MTAAIVASLPRRQAFAPLLDGLGHRIRRRQEADMAAEQHSTPPPEHTDRTGLCAALWLPIFDGLADPAVVARLAAEAEEAGWHGIFVWDHLRWRAPVRQVADPWITLAAIATATHQLRLGPMVTPLARRRPAKVARETATLDRLSGGRLTLGVGLGSDRFANELSKPASSSMIGCEAGCSTRRWRSSPPPGPVRRCTTAAPTTPSTASSSCPDRCSNRVCRCGPRASPATASRCAGPPGTTVSSRPTLNTPISSPRSSPPSPISAGTARRRTTSPSGSRRMRSRWTLYVECSATAQRHPDPRRRARGRRLAARPA